LEYSQNVGRLTGSTEQQISQLWHQLERVKEETEDALRKIQRAIEELAETAATKQQIETLQASLTSLEARVAALEEEDEEP